MRERERWGGVCGVEGQEVKREREVTCARDRYVKKCFEREIEVCGVTEASGEGREVTCPF